MLNRCNSGILVGGQSIGNPNLWRRCKLLVIRSHPRGNTGRLLHEILLHDLRFHVVQGGTCDGRIGPDRHKLFRTHYPTIRSIADDPTYDAPGTCA